MRIDSAIITGSFSVNGDTFNDLGAYSTTGSNTFTGSQNITGSLVVSGAFNLNDSATNFSIQGNIFSQTYLNSNGAIVLNPGYGGVEVVGSYRELRLNDIYANGFVSGEIRANNGVVSGSSQIVGILSSLNSFTASNSTTNTFTSSAAARLNSIETITASNVARLNSLEAKTGSLATTGSNTFIGTQIFSGSLFVQDNLVVQGSSSLQNITASAVSIGTNTVVLNTANPSVRFGGISVVDSGSAAGKSGSLYFDSRDDEWIFVHQGNTAVTSSIVITGPETYDSLGNETRLTTNSIPKIQSGFHIVDSCITDNGTAVCVNTTLKINGNVGIGATPSVWGNGTECALQIKNASIYEYGSYETALQVNAFYNTLVAPSGWKYISTGVQCIGQLQLSGGDLTYNVANPGTAGCAITWDSKFNINRRGNVGINTASQNASSVLHVKMCSNSNGDGIRVQAICTGGAGSQPGIAFSNTSDSKRWNIAMDTSSDTLQITNAGGSNVFNVNQSCVICTGPVTIVGMQGGTDTTVIAGGSGYGSSIRMNYAGGSYNNYLAGNGDNYFNCLLGKLNAAGGVKFGGGATTLNYYEQGTWTPRLKNGSFTTNAGVSNVGWYTRIGNLVTVGGTLDWGAGSGAQDGNSLQIACLPFASSNTSNERNVGQPGAPAANSMGFKCTGKGQLVLVGDPGNSFIYIIETLQDGSYTTYIHNPLVANAGTLYGFQMTYHI